ncbi:MAG TPA: VIT1/CCC1 transporter family protein [Vicinamibacterales bacterium]
MASPVDPRHEPRGARAVVQHYLGDLVYGANDGIITTFAVVAGVAGASLSERTVLAVGVANLLADGLSMAVGNYHSIRSSESVRRAQGLPVREPYPLRHGGATFAAFVAAGSVPLLPYVLHTPPDWRFTSALAATLTALFVVGSMRAAVTEDRWWRNGLEMLGLGAVVACVAYYAGQFVATLTG